MATYVLIHGAWHGAWCWEYLKAELEKEGHKVITPNLPIDTSATLVDYADLVIKEIGEADDPIVIGHSMAGLLLPVIAEKTFVRRLVYLCGVLRRAGQSLEQDHQAGVNPGLIIPGFENVKTDEGEGFSSLKKEAIPFFYDDCTSEIQEWAFSKLRKQHSYWNEENPQKEWSEASVSAIICTEDKAINPAWSEQVAKDWLEVTPITLPGSHSPFLSRPKELAEILMNEI
jgi:pimeloyl-ACP methyl ester carboxylesterase